MKAGYIISGIVLVSLATVFAFVSGLLAVILYSNNLASSLSNSAASPFTGDFQNALILTLVVGSLFYIVGAIFLWQGFKVQPVYYPPRYPVSYPTPYSTTYAPPGITPQTVQKSPYATTTSPLPSSAQSPATSSTTMTTTSPNPSLTTSTILANCPRCNARIPAEAKFCPSCGTDLRPKPPMDPVVQQ